MLIPVARYTFLLWLFINPHKDPQKLNLDQLEEDQNINRITTCTASCMQQPQLQYQYSHLEHCFDKCRNVLTSSSAEKKTTTKKHITKIQENFSLNLICRDDRSLSFRIDLENTSATKSPAAASNKRYQAAAESAAPEIVKTAMTTAKGQPSTDTIFIITIHVAKDAEEYLVFLSDDSFFTIGDLKNNMAYNISVVALHASGEYSDIATQQQYATLRRGFTPGIVKEIQARDFYVDEANDMLLMAKIAWKPAADMTCRYDLICISPESEEYDLTPIEISNPRQLHTFYLENLKFSSVYKVGIRANNPHDLSKESELKWQTFTAPSCVQWHNYNFNICAPLEPEGFEVEQIFRGKNEFSLNITWQPTLHLPDYFTARILDLSPHGISFVTNVSNELTSLYIPKIALTGILFEVQLTAYTPGGSSTAVLTLLTQQHPIVSAKNHIVKLISAILAIVFCIVILSLAIFIIFHRRAKMKRYQERCKYFDELEKKAPIDPEAAFEFPTKCLPEDYLTQFQLKDEKKLLFIDAMEIERSAVKLYEVLGEGAFGLVRRGLFRDEKLGQLEVAVKMLKDQPSSDDVRAFRREIEVMKAVERHPNIVGIIGHCTKTCDDMLLLTEYCSFGNLLDLLRDEWKYLHELSTKLGDTGATQPTSTASTAMDNKSYGYDEICTNSCKCQVDIVIDHSDSHHEQQTTSPANAIDCECQQQKSQQLANKGSSAVENKSYFEDNASGDINSNVIEDTVLSAASLNRIPLSAGDLLDIARQVAVGMMFLANNKVVHRDLAARNVLVAPDRTIKIADFGLSRDIYQENIYKKIGNGKLPIKWLALESMTHQVYSTQSDVWSYGILLYEIVTLGGSPYPAIPTNHLLQMLKSGFRMEKPRGCCQEFYNLMHSCWHVNPGERPKFSEIINQLDNLKCESPPTQKLEEMASPEVPTEDAYLQPL